MFEQETIAAIATSSKNGSISVIRVSGENSFSIVSRIFCNEKGTSIDLNKKESHTIQYGFIFDGLKKIDEVLVLLMKAPKSYTAEDVVEIQCHGGHYICQVILDLLVRHGVRVAEPGEFTKRAFLSGRISLTQAEAVMDLINATSRQAAAAAAAAMEGALYAKIKSVQENLVSLAGHIAAYTDYPEEDVPELSMGALEASLGCAKAALDKLIAGYDAGAVLRRGVDTAIIGSPNVGKSTLLNLLSGFERAIVTPVAGTTRDVVEQEIQLAGVRLLLADTAGIRDTDDLVEAEGIRRSYRHLERAGLVLAVFDGSAPLSPADLSLAEKCAGRPAVAILNKTDLPQQADEESLRPYFSTVVNISAKDAAFLPAVEQAVTDALHLAEADPDAGLLANERQLAAARTAQAALADALEAVNGGYTLDAAGVCVDDALRALYELTGENAGDDVIDEVFSRFCVGK